MSYILDALRKADSDRERGSVPGIHTLAVAGTAGDDTRSGRGGPLVWAVVVLSALLVALLAWLLVGRDAPPEPAPASVALPPPVVMAAAPAPVVAPPAPAPAPATAPTVSATPPAPQAAKVTAPRPNPALPSAAPPVARAAVAAPPPPPASSEARIYATNELPDTIRRDLPQVTVGGSIYSDNPANRFLIINGQVVHEGDKIGPELWLDQIRLKAAVLRFRDYRYMIRF